MAKCPAEAFHDLREKLEATATNESLHPLDRIDAYLELAQILHRDPNQAWRHVRNARDLISKQ